MILFSKALGVSGLAPSKVGGTGTNPMIFPGLMGAGFQVASIAPAAIIVPNNGVFEGQLINIVAAGKVFVHGTSPTLNFVLQNGTSLTAASNTTMATLSAAQALVTAATYPFCVEVGIQGDSTSGIVQVVYASATINGVAYELSANGRVDSPKITQTSLTGISFLPTQPTATQPDPIQPNQALSLVFGLTFGVSDALNAASLDSMYAEA